MCFIIILFQAHVQLAITARIPLLIHSRVPEERLITEQCWLLLTNAQLVQQGRCIMINYFHWVNISVIHIKLSEGFQTFGNGIRSHYPIHWGYSLQEIWSVNRYCLCVYASIQGYEWFSMFGITRWIITKSYKKKSLPAAICGAYVVFLII